MKLYITHFRRPFSYSSTLTLVESDIVDSKAFFIDRHVYFSYKTGKNYLHCYIVSITPVHFLGSSDFRKIFYSKNVVEIDYSWGNTVISFEEFKNLSSLHNYSYGGEDFNIYFSFTEELARTIKEGLRKAHNELYYYDNC